MEGESVGVPCPWHVRVHRGNEKRREESRSPVRSQACPADAGGLIREERLSFGISGRREFWR